MEPGKGASEQWTLSPQPYPIPRSHVLGGMQVRGFKHNPRTCPNWTLDPCQGRGLLGSHGRASGDKPAARLTNIVPQGSVDGRSQLLFEPEICPRYYPLGVRG